jgi:hypothetical protein
MQGKITLQSVKALLPGEEIFDTDLRGFQVRRQRNAIMYSVRRKQAERNVRHIIGEHGAWTPTTATIARAGCRHDPRAAKTAVTTLRVAAMGFMDHIREKRAFWASPYASASVCGAAR